MAQKKKWLKVKPSARLVCDLCKSENIRVNVSRTKFCDHCHHCITRSGNVYRTIDHPLFKSDGYNVPIEESPHA